VPELLELLPVAAAAFAVPQFWPQVRKLFRTRDVGGLSWAWAALTSVNNAAWFCYFVGSAYWAALLPSASVTTLAGALAVVLAHGGRMTTRSAGIVTAWSLALAIAYASNGLAGLGLLLTGAMVVQVAPSLWVAYTAPRPTGISAGTWGLVAGELSCWLAYGLYQGDPRLVTLGCIGVTASALMLGRVLFLSTPDATGATADLD
jgi:hypothetical protein